jgi:hypothetical protein
MVSDPNLYKSGYVHPVHSKTNVFNYQQDPNIQQVPNIFSTPMLGKRNLVDL